MTAKEMFEELGYEQQICCKQGNICFEVGYVISEKEYKIEDKLPLSINIYEDYENNICCTFGGLFLNDKKGYINAKINIDWKLQKAIKKQKEEMEIH